MKKEIVRCQISTKYTDACGIIAFRRTMLLHVAACLIDSNTRQLGVVFGCQYR